MTCKTVSGYLMSKTLYSFLCCSTSFVLGWFFSMDGPSLLELQLNTGVTFTMASSYITSFNVANVLRTLGVGFFLYKRMNVFLLITIGLAVAAASVVAIPFCLAYIPMMISHICFGVSTGGLDILTAAEMSVMWGSETEVPMHALYFASSLGAVISPICTTPFLKNLEDIHLFQEDVELFQENGDIGSVVNSSVFPCKNSSIVNVDTTRCLRQQALEAPSRLYIPYSISAGLAVIVLFPAFVIFILYINNRFSVTYSHDNTSADQKRVSGKFLYVVLLITGLMSSLDTSIEDCLSDFLPSFCVTQMGWNSQTSAYTVSVFRVSIVIGRLVGIILTAASFSSIKLMTSHCLLLITAHIGILISGSYSLDYGIWISSALSGFGTSVLSPCIFTLIEENFIPVSGKIAAYFVMVASLGSGVNSLLIGYLMENISTMYFIYVLLIECIVYLILISVCIVLIRSKPDSNNDRYELRPDTQEPPCYITHL